MAQKKAMSFLESLVSVSAGYAITVAVQIYLFPLFDIAVPVEQIMFVSVILVGMAFIKNYAVRRLFGFIHERSVG